MVALPSPHITDYLINAGNAVFHRCPQDLARRTNVDVLRLVEREVFPREPWTPDRRPILTPLSREAVSC